MIEQDFDKFVEQKSHDGKSAQSMNWDKEKLEWLKRLAAFYSKVEEYLAEYIKSRKITIESSLITLDEQHIGAYQADFKKISIGPDTIKLMPMGTLLIGAKGRVDMVGPAGTVKFVLTSKNPNGAGISAPISEKRITNKSRPAAKPGRAEEFVWQIATRPPQVVFIDLNRDTFLNALMEVVNG